MNSADRPKEILLAEDNDGDIVLLQQALLEYGHGPYRFHIVHDGEAAEAFVKQEGFYADAPRPHVIVLDIGLPKQSGWDTLASLKATSALPPIPVIMLTGVLTEGDTEHIAQLQPTRCLRKPADLKGYQQLVKSIEEVMSQNNSSV